MSLPDNDRGRLVTTQTASKMSTLTDSHSVDRAGDDRPRCRRCGHVVFSSVSIRVGIGLACRRALARAAQEVAA